MLVKVTALVNTLRKKGSYEWLSFSDINAEIIHDEVYLWIRSESEDYDFKPFRFIFAFAKNYFNLTIKEIRYKGPYGEVYLTERWVTMTDHDMTNPCLEIPLEYVRANVCALGRGILADTVEAAVELGIIEFKDIDRSVSFGRRMREA